MQVGISNHENDFKSLGEYEYEIEKLVNLVMNMRSRPLYTSIASWYLKIWFWYIVMLNLRSRENSGRLRLSNFVVYANLWLVQALVSTLHSFFKIAS